MRVTDLDFETIDRLGLEAAQEAYTRHSAAGRLSAIDGDGGGHTEPPPTEMDGLAGGAFVEKSRIVSVNLATGAAIVLVVNALIGIYSDFSGRGASLIAKIPFSVVDVLAIAAIVFGSRTARFSFVITSVGRLVKKLK